MQFGFLRCGNFFKKLQKKALEKIEKNKLPYAPGLIEEIVKKAFEKIEELPFVDKTKSN